MTTLRIQRLESPDTRAASPPTHGPNSRTPGAGGRGGLNNQSSRYSRGSRWTTRAANHAMPRIGATTVAGRGSRTAVRATGPAAPGTRGGVNGNDVAGPLNARRRKTIPTQRTRTGNSSGAKSTSGACANQCFQTKTKATKIVGPKKNAAAAVDAPTG